MNNSQMPETLIFLFVESTSIDKRLNAWSEFWILFWILHQTWWKHGCVMKRDATIQSNHQYNCATTQSPIVWKKKSGLQWIEALRGKYINKSSCFLLILHTNSLCASVNVYLISEILCHFPSFYALLPGSFKHSVKCNSLPSLSWHIVAS